MTMDFKFYLRIFLRRLPYFLVMLVLGTTAGVSLAVLLPPVYNSGATLIVESEQIPDDLAASTVRTEATEQISIIRRRILSRDVLLELANRQNIYAGEPPMAADEKVADLRRRIDISTSGGPATRREPARATVVEVEFSAPTGRMAADVTNELVTLILQENVEMRTTVAGQTLEFFTGEVNRLDRELSELSARILDFKERNLNSLPDSLEFRRSQQAGLQERLAQLTRDESTLRDRRDRLAQMIEAGADAQQAEGSLSVEAQQLKDLKNRYANSVAVLSSGNPKVVVLRRRIDALEAIVAEQQAAESGALPQEGGRMPSSLEIQLSDLDGQLDYIVEQKEIVETRMASLERSIENTPGNAVTLDALERDYRNVQEQYNRAVSNRAQAETGDVIESLSKGQRISVVEQAVVPSGPDSPDRPLIAAAGFGGGLTAGLALVLLLEILNNAIRRPVEITGKLGIVPFATIPYIWTEREIRRRKTVILGTVAAICIAVPLILWFVDTRVTPLEPIFDKVLSQMNLAAGPAPTHAATA